MIMIVSFRWYPRSKDPSCSIWFSSLVWFSLVTFSPARDLGSELRHLFSLDFRGVEIDAPEGVVILESPDAGARVLRTIPDPMTLKATNYIEDGLNRYYLTADGRDLFFEEKPTYWVTVPGTHRAEFIGATTPAVLVKRETRDFLKTGPQTAEVYEESVNLVPTTEWGPEFRRAEVDFRLPLKVSAFRPNDGGWELDLSVFPAFESDTNRIPGPQPEFHDDPYRALITRPVQREIHVRGVSGAGTLASLFLPGTVWAGAFSEGRLQSLRIGWHDIEPPYEVSRLSPPQIRRGGTLGFRFLANRLLEGPAEIIVSPDRITGVDGTYYDQMALLGGPKGAEPEPEFEDYLHRLWNITVAPDGLVTVVAPLLDGRGAAGMLELESLGLGPGYEEELKALAEMGKAEAPPAGAAPSPEWISIFERALGEIPAAQRGPETDPGF